MTRAKQSSPVEERREVEWRTLGDLLLDSHNPRLPDGYEKAGQPELLRVLAEDYALADIGRSIAANGYFSEEPLVTVKHPTQKKWLVIEGNRRLAALLLLNSPTKAPATLQGVWKDISAGAAKRVDEVPTLVYRDRAEITPYLGFRHITGVLEWRPYQKARYISQLVEKHKLSFDAIAQLIGSKAKTVREHYVSYTLVRQAYEDFNIDTESVEESFGILRRALSDPNIRAYVGLSLDKTERELAKPLKKSDAAKLKNAFQWMFGTKSKAAVLKDSRDLTRFGYTLGNKGALSALQTTGDLNYAYELSGGEEKRLIETLSRASYQLDQALPMILRHRSSKEVRSLAEKCREVMDEISRLIGSSSK